MERNLSLSDKIKELLHAKNAILLAHFYQRSEVQEVADFLGDSLALAQQAAKTDAEIIVFAGVHFMAETAKILNPDKKVLIPDLAAGCSLADSCPAADFEQFIKQHPGHTVVTYINCSAEVKALSDIICTSSNAVQIINSLPKDEKIIFAPDKNLGSYINSVTGRQMVLWDGACHVHAQFSIEKTLQLKLDNRDAMLIVHPECRGPIVTAADYVGSTTALLNYTKTSPAKKFIVGTESGIIHQMKKYSPDKIFLEAPVDESCNCSDCEYMKLNTLEKIYNCLLEEKPALEMDTLLMSKAEKPIRRMLDLSAQLGL